MDFEFAAAERAFIAEVREFIASNRTQNEIDGVFAPDREADSMLADSQARRDFNQRLSAAGYLGMSWDPTNVRRLG